MNYVRVGTSSSLQYFMLKSKTLKIYSVVQRVKLLLALSICSAEIETKLLHHYCRLFISELEKSHIYSAEIGS